MNDLLMGILSQKGRLWTTWGQQDWKTGQDNSDGFHPLKQKSSVKIEHLTDSTADRFTSWRTYLKILIFGQLLQRNYGAHPHADGRTRHPLDPLENVGHRLEEAGDAANDLGGVGKRSHDLIGQGVFPKGNGPPSPGSRVTRCQHAAKFDPCPPTRRNPRE